MKTILAFLILISLTLTAASQSKYEQTMKSTIEKMNSNENPAGFQDAANTFERISMNESGEWLPLYYVAYSYIIISYQEQDLTKKDPYLDKAQGFLDKAIKIESDESELFALQAFLYPSRMTVDPMTRGMEYLDKLNGAIDKAIELNPENPRSYYLKAVITLNMPEAFGGGASVAKPIFETAKEKFEKFVPESPIHPDWGKEINQSELDKL
ncbi:MAG: hypothetical protein JXR31_02535 [Prolixibacteraceae bacterium]|nr:hypothetical protein [Prolixibacteraceae bacterium]MBN2773099.1 hypothetical protein [Prolixibacteraceae bacterium]